MTSTSFILSNNQARSKVNILVVKNSQLVWYMDYWLKQPRRKYMCCIYQEKSLSVENLSAAFSNYFESLVVHIVYCSQTIYKLIN